MIIQTQYTPKLVNTLMMLVAHTLTVSQSDTDSHTSTVSRSETNSHSVSRSDTVPRPHHCSTIGWSHLDNHQMPLSISFSTVTIKSLLQFHFFYVDRMTLLKWAGDLVFLTDFFAYEIRVSYRLKKHLMTHFTYVGLFSFFFGRFFDTCAIFSMWSGHYFTMENES